jgi:hypothetical protein
MKNAIRIILVLVAVLLVFVQTRPDHFRVERSATIAASGETVYSHLANFHDWAAWSPWERLDPSMQRTFDGPESGVGAGYHWVGNKQVGEGSMKITAATPGSNVTIDLEFIKPFQASNVTMFTLAPEGGGTKVTWAMEGKNNFVGKAMCLVMNMDKTVGGDFERGLAQLKTVAERAPAAAAADTTKPAAPAGVAVK